MREVFQEPPIVAFRRDKNVTPMLPLKPTSINCKLFVKKCALMSRDMVRDSSNKLTFQLAQDVTCRIRNVVYIMICTRCQATVYVGETETEVWERMTEHLRDVRLEASPYTSKRRPHTQGCGLCSTAES